MISLRGPLFAVCLLTLFSMGCGTAPEAPEAPDSAEVTPDPDEPPPESADAGSKMLAIHMGRMQRYADKLGYSIRGKNMPLASFYVKEIGEVYQEISKIEMHEGMPIAQPAGVILKPALPPLEASLKAERWEEAWGYYTMLVNACNRCHTATVHQYIEILPVEGEPPYFQRFGVE